MKQARKVRKRCAKCGAVGLRSARQARCRAQKFGPGSYLCWGTLQSVAKTARPEQQPVDGTTASARGRRVRAEAERKLALARKAAHVKQVSLSELAWQAARAAKQLVVYQRRASYYAKRASLTDAEIEAERTARAARPKKTRRALALGKELQ